MKRDLDERCPRCGSPDPARHPATQWEGEVQPCPHPWHEPTDAEEAVTDVRPWRVGRSVGRTLYDADDQLIGLMDTPELARAVVEAVNASDASDAPTAEPERDYEDEDDRG